MQAGFYRILLSAVRLTVYIMVVQLYILFPCSLIQTLRVTQSTSKDWLQRFDSNVYVVFYVLF